MLVGILYKSYLSRFHLYHICTTVSCALRLGSPSINDIAVLRINSWNIEIKVQYI